MPKLQNYKCKGCNDDLIAMNWNDNCWLLVCKNNNCIRVHVPQGTVKKGSKEEATLMQNHGLIKTKAG